MVIDPSPPVNPPAAPSGAGAAVDSPVPLQAVDTHFHVFTAGARAPGPVRYVPAYAATLAAWSEAAGLQGVTAGVVVQVSFLSTDNTQLLAALASAPGRLRGVAVLAPDTPDHALDTMDAAGVRGVRWNLIGTDHRIDDDARRFAQRLAARGWHVEVHAEPGRLVPVLDCIPPDVPVVVDHCGRPDGPEDTVTWSGAQRHAARLWVKLSGPYRQHAPHAPGLMGSLARRWRDTVGPARLLWGSDWPCTNHEDWRTEAHAHRWLHEALGRSDADAVLRHNPAALYRF